MWGPDSGPALSTARSPATAAVAFGPFPPPWGSLSGFWFLGFVAARSCSSVFWLWGVSAPGSLPVPPCPGALGAGRCRPGLCAAAVRRARHGRTPQDSARHPTGAACRGSGGPALFLGVGRRSPPPPSLSPPSLPGRPPPPPPGRVAAPWRSVSPWPRDSLPRPRGHRASGAGPPPGGVVVGVFGRCGPVGGGGWFEGVGAPPPFSLDLCGRPTGTFCFPAGWCGRRPALCLGGGSSPDRGGRGVGIRSFLSPTVHPGRLPISRSEASITGSGSCPPCSREVPSLNTS